MAARCRMAAGRHLDPLHGLEMDKFRLEKKAILQAGGGCRGSAQASGGGGCRSLPWLCPAPVSIEPWAIPRVSRGITHFPAVSSCLGKASAMVTPDCTELSPAAPVLPVPPSLLPAVEPQSCPGTLVRVLRGGEWETRGRPPVAALAHGNRMCPAHGAQNIPWHHPLPRVTHTVPSPAGL